VPTSGGITQPRQRLGHEPLKELFAQVAVPVRQALALHPASIAAKLEPLALLGRNALS
jgi:hypothetical protein